MNKITSNMRYVKIEDVGDVLRINIKKVFIPNTLIQVKKAH